MDEKKSAKKIWVVGGCILLIAILVFGAIGFVCGKNSALDSAALNTVAEQKRAADTEYQGLQEKLEKTEKDLQDVQNELDSHKALLDEFNDYKENKDTYETELSEKALKIDGLNTEIEKLDGDIASKNEELERLKTGIVKANAEPKVLPAGNFVVGRDLEAGRYSVTGSRNFIVHTATGGLKVNTILGGGRIGVENYVCDLSNGDEMELSGKCTFTPVQ